MSPWMVPLPMMGIGGVRVPFGRLNYDARSLVEVLYHGYRVPRYTHAFHDAV